jgi:hypothetical protein
MGGIFAVRKTCREENTDGDFLDLYLHALLIHCHETCRHITPYAVSGGDAR